MITSHIYPEDTPVKTESEYSASFPPVVGDKPRILILGTLPGQESLRQQQYYAHPRNAFWKILFRIFNTKFASDYETRLTLIKKNQVALWDICRLGVRKGSLDSDIRQEIPNAIPGLIAAHPTLTNIFFNGKKAELLFGKYFGWETHIAHKTLLSTSPANATYTFEQKLANWQQIKCG